MHFCSACLWFIDHTHSFSMRMRLRMLKHCVWKGSSHHETATCVPHSAAILRYSGYMARGVCALVIIGLDSALDLLSVIQPLVSLFFLFQEGCPWFHKFETLRISGIMCKSTNFLRCWIQRIGINSENWFKE